MTYQLDGQSALKDVYKEGHRMQVPSYWTTGGDFRQYVGELTLAAWKLES